MNILENPTWIPKKGTETSGPPVWILPLDAAIVFASITKFRSGGQRLYPAKCLHQRHQAAAGRAQALRCLRAIASPLHSRLRRQHKQVLDRRAGILELVLGQSHQPLQSAVHRNLGARRHCLALHETVASTCVLARTSVSVALFGLLGRVGCDSPSPSPPLRQEAREGSENCPELSGSG